jgi:hypothetical protein
VLSRRTPMRRAGFKSRAPTAPARDPDRVRSTPTVTPGAWRAPEQVITGASRVQKAALVRSETYRRLVASLPCVICGMPWYSQAAHGSEGKGMGIKACDLTCFPACGPRPGAQGCHAALDQGALFPKAARRQLEPAWAADTQRRLLAMGLVPPCLMQPISEALQGSTQRQPKEQPKD